jgi:hypothetical protein
MFLEVLNLTYHIPITIDLLTCGVTNRAPRYYSKCVPVSLETSIVSRTGFASGDLQVPFRI